MFTVLKLARVRGAAVACLAAVMLIMACYVVPQVYLAYVVSAERGAGEVLQGIWLYLLLSFLAYPLSYAASLVSGNRPPIFRYSTDKEWYFDLLRVSPT